MRIITKKVFLYLLFFVFFKKVNLVCEIDKLFRHLPRKSNTKLKG